MKWKSNEGDTMSHLEFVIAMMLLNAILRKGTGGYKLTKSQEKINHLMYVVDIKLVTINEKEPESLIQTIRIYSKNIKIEIGLEKCAMLIRRSRKRQLTEGKELPHRGKIRTLWEKENYKYLEKFKKNTSEERENCTKPNY